MKRHFFQNRLFLPVLLSIFISFLQGQNVVAQGITTYQYRQVPPDKLTEFIKRESNYWSKVARKAIDKGNLTFWALLVKVGGVDLPNSPNVLFVNTYSNIDDNLADIWNATAVFPNVPIADMETTSLGKTVAEYFLKDNNWVQAKNATGKDFNYIVMVYENSTNPTRFIEMENRHWAPFIQKAMDAKQTAQIAWGNATVLAPSGSNKFTNVSYDLFPTLKSALVQDWNPNTQFPTPLFDSLLTIRPTVPERELYRVVKVESKM